MKILCSGDSLVNGFPYARSHSFPSVLARETGIEVTNIGMNGITAGDVSRMLRSKLNEDSFDAVLISCGSNDFMLGTAGPAQVCDIVSKMCDDAISKGVRDIYVCAPPLTDPEQAQRMWMPGVSYEFVNSQLEEYGQLLAKLSRDHGKTDSSDKTPASQTAISSDTQTAVHFIDIQAAYRSFARYADGVHPTEEGYALIANAVAYAISTTFPL